ncbi:MAG: ATPase [Roseinatronobacter sp.]|jgi:glucosamine kinase|nr:ATPase [Roseinatronobacter sp.]
MRVCVGLDGGGTGCRALVAFEDGLRLPVQTGGAANVSTDPDSAIAAIADLLARAMAAAQAHAGATRLEPEIVLGLAGVVESGLGPRVRAALRYPRLSVLGDIEIALAGAFEDMDGLVMVVGTGSVLACQRGGQMQRLGGYGLGLGDEASGAWIGRAALRQSLLARDGLATDGPLAAALWQHFGSLAAMIEFAATARPADYAALAPVVLEHDHAHCPVAGAVLDAGCGYLRAAIARLQAGAHDMPVAALGGLGPVLLARIIAQGGAAFPVVRPKGSALEGALWLARRRCDMGQEGRT